MKSRKQIKKLIDKQCFFCKEAKAELLDVHRILPNTAGGRYTTGNMIVCCSSCHRACHAGYIRIDRYYFSTAGVDVLHYWIGEQEFWSDGNR